MAEVKKYLDLGGLEIFWGKVKAQYQAADKVISDALAQEVSDREAAIKVITDDYLTSADKTELSGAISAEATARANADTALEGRIKALEDDTAAADGIDGLNNRVTALEGDDAGSSVREIVIDEVAKQLTSDNISDSFDTLKEMAEYLSSHPQDVTEMNDAIKANADAIDAIEADYLKAADKTELSNAIAAEATARGEVAEAIRGEFAAADAVLAGRITTLEGLQGNYASATDLTTEVNRAKAAEDKIEASVGLAEDGSFVAYTDKNYINSASSVRGEIVKLDAALKSHVDAYGEKMTALDAEDAAIRKAFADADTALDGKITALDTAYKAADTALEGRVKALEDETADIRTDFADADTALDGKITALDTAYKAADTALDGKITAVDTAYKAADESLLGKITALEGVQGNYATKTELQALEASFVAITTNEIDAIFA